MARRHDLQDRRGRRPFHTGGEAGPADTVYLGVFRRAALDRVGGYDEHFLRAQDWEMNHRIRDAGGPVWFQPRMRVTYRPRADLRALSSQYFHYGRWRRVVARQHRARSTSLPRAARRGARRWRGGAGGGCGRADRRVAGPWRNWPGCALGFAVTGAYLGGILAAAAASARGLRPGRGRMAAWCWRRCTSAGAPAS